MIAIFHTLTTNPPAWVVMWALSVAIFAVCKLLALAAAKPGGGWRRVAFLCAWPGMDANAFIHGRTAVPLCREWCEAFGKTALGAVLYFAVARRFEHPLAAGWVGMVGIIFLMHFGGFHLLSLFWRTIGVNAQPIMDNPVAAQSAGEFWGRRWNLAFNELAVRFVFRPLTRSVGVQRAGIAAFLVSGVIHELVISVPAGGGWGLPTAYFFLQGCCVALERSAFGKKYGLRGGVQGWLFTMLLAGGPAFFLFHPPFVRDVIVPMMKATGAL
jgi:hypothetical protein